MLFNLNLPTMKVHVLNSHHGGNIEQFQYSSVPIANRNPIEKFTNTKVSRAYSRLATACSTRMNTGVTSRTAMTSTRRHTATAHPQKLVPHPQKALAQGRLSDALAHAHRLGFGFTMYTYIPYLSITSGSAKSSAKPRIDSTPSLPPAKQNGGLVTSHDGSQTSKPQSPEKSKRSTADVKPQSIPNISQKNNDKSSTTDKRTKGKDGTHASRQPPTSPSKTNREEPLPSSPSKTKRDDKLPSSPSKTKREEQPPSSPSKTKRDEKPPPSPLKENQSSSVDQNKSGKSTSSKTEAATVKSQSNKENNKPSQDQTNVQKTNGKFVATYTRTRPERKTENNKENNKTENNKERMDFSPQSRTTDDTIADSNVSKDSAYRWHAPARKYETPRHNLPVKSKAVTINSASASSNTTGSSHKPPVFKLKLHKKPMYSRDKKAKEKEVVLTPRTQKSSQDSSRPKSYHLERDRSIYRTNTYLWEDERNELTYQPSTNTQTDVMMAYTGEPNTREALKSASDKTRAKEFKKAFTVFAVRSKQPPWHEKEYVLNRREAHIYQGIKQVYDKPTAKKARQREFMKKLEQFQVEMAKHQMSEIQRKEAKKNQDKARQANQLKELRQRFEDEAWHRFQTQYVTSRVLEHEKMNRFQYGLPEEPDGEPEFAVKLKRKKKNPQAIIDAKQLSKINKKRYSEMFDVNTGPSWSTSTKDPKMEGIDTVVLDVKDEQGGAVVARKEEGNVKEKKKFVKDVIQEAQKELQASPGNGKNTGVTPRSPVLGDAAPDQSNQRAKTPDFYAEESESDDDDDMSDIFERARKKYNLTVDEEADAVSRASRVR